MPMMHIVESLIEITEVESARLKTLSARLETASPQELPAVLEAVGECCTTLSASLSKLGKHVDSIPEIAKRLECPPDDPRLMELSRMLFDQIGDALCDSTDAPEYTAETNAQTADQSPKLRARRAAD